MSFNPKEIALVLLVVLATGGIVRYCAPGKIVYDSAEKDRKLDSLTTLTRSLRIDKSQLSDSLEGTTKAFQEYVEENEDKLIAYNRIVGRLNLQIDSLANTAGPALSDLENLIPDSSGHLFRDTTLTRSATFGNGLIEAVATGGIRNDSLFLDQPEIRQLRAVRIHHAQFVSEDGSEVRSLVSSKDFEELKSISVTTIEKEGKRFPWIEIVAVGSFILGYAL